MAPVASKPVDELALAPTPTPTSSLSTAGTLPQNDNVAHAIAGAGGGILSTILTYPLITLSTRAQVESRRADSSFWAAVEHIVAREGVAGLYSGLDSAVFGIGVTNFVYYYWYEFARGFFERRAVNGGRLPSSHRLTTLESMLAGALAGSATVILTNPIWVVNTRMTTRRQGGGPAAVAKAEAAAAAAQSDEKVSESVVVVAPGEGSELAPSSTALGKGSDLAPSSTPSPTTTPPPRITTLGTLLALLREEGIRGLFAGVVPALVLVVNPILQYTLFEQLKNTLQARRSRGSASGSPPPPFTPAMAFVLGALSKLFATSITYPYITVKSRMHVAKDRSDGVIAALRRVVKNEGYAGLYKGIGPKVTQSVLTAALLFAFKDVLYAQSVRLRARTASKALKA